MNFSLHQTTDHKKNKFNFLLLLTLSLLVLLFISCSSTKRFTEESGTISNSESNFIRVLINEKTDELSLNVDSPIILSNVHQKIAKINSGNKILFTKVEDKLKATISDKTFLSDTFFISSGEEDSILRIDEKKIRGRLKIFTVNSQIKVVNQIGLEDYVKGVITKEMPLGKGNENYEALKAFSICVRTYALLKISENKSFFDIYPDTRDQVYGGVDAENPLSNKIVDETRGQILLYNGSPAVIFYHAACGGYTEDAKNVFSKNDLPYLKSIQDGEQPFCSIAPKFYWTEEFPESLFISRLFDAKLITNKNYSIISLDIKSRFESGRVKELNISLIDSSQITKNITLLGNGIRSIIKTSDGKSILRSTFFDISLDENNKVIISGKGYGHGVGLCQWGAIGQSRQGIDYQTILKHYFPGTKISN
mgnify:CR=1 FL=1